MSNPSGGAKRGDYQAVIQFNERIAHDIYQMDLLFTGEGADAFQQLQPGQFAELDLSKTTLPDEKDVPMVLRDKLQRQIILRRPFSFSHGYTTDEGVVAELIYAAIGPASLRMTAVQRGDTMAVIGPLGQGFTVSQQRKVALLVGGGLGTPPIEHLARLLSAERPEVETTVFVGSRSVDVLPFDTQVSGSSVTLPPFEACRVPYTLATDDGSAGHHGLVTECLESWIQAHRDRPPDTIEIFACGPEPMLAATAQVAQKHRLACQVSLERRMACGFNLCQGCAVECRDPQAQDTVYKMCCEAGPVFRGDEVVFALS